MRGMLSRNAPSLRSQGSQPASRPRPYGSAVACSGPVGEPCAILSPIHGPRILARTPVVASAAIRTRNAGGMSEFGDTVDREDIDRFAAQSAAWWDPE